MSGRGEVGPHDPVRELRIWTLGGEALTSSLRAVCTIRRPRPETWLENLAEEHPNFIVVEADESVAAEWGEALARLLDACGAAGVPRFLWLAAGPLDRFQSGLCERFDRVFTADRNLLPGLEAAGASMPAILWPAAAAPLPHRGEENARQRAREVVWLGGWCRDWPESWRERVTAVLEAAGERGLRILPVEKLDGLPEQLQRFVADAEGTEEAALRRARVAIGADPADGAPGYCSPSIFAAAAHGAAVVTPHDFTVNFELAIAEWRGPRPIEAIAVVRDARAAGLEIDRLLDDEPLRRDVVAHTTRILANNHTASHRLATLATAAGLRTLPDAPDPAPA